MWERQDPVLSKNKTQIFNLCDLQNTLCPLMRKMIPYLLSLDTHQYFIKYFFTFHFICFVHNEIKKKNNPVLKLYYAFCFLLHNQKMLQKILLWCLKKKKQKKGT